MQEQRDKEASEAALVATLEVERVADKASRLEIKWQLREGHVSLSDSDKEENEERLPLRQGSGS